MFYPFLQPKNNSRPSLFCDVAYSEGGAEFLIYSISPSLTFPSCDANGVKAPDNLQLGNFSVHVYPDSVAEKGDTCEFNIWPISFMDLNTVLPFSASYRATTVD